MFKECLECVNCFKLAIQNKWQFGCSCDHQKYLVIKDNEQHCALFEKNTKNKGEKNESN